MTDNGHRALADTVFDRGHAGESEPSDALKLEAARREAVVENMRARWRFARWTLFHGGRSALCAMRCRNHVEDSVTAITFRRNSAGNWRQKRLRSLYFRSPELGRAWR
jgi:hypothetical protein